MLIKTLEDFEEYEPYCSICWIDLNDVRELHFEGHCHGEGFHLCIDCRKKLAQMLFKSIYTPSKIVSIYVKDRYQKEQIEGKN